jgi:hypothetical protein
MDKEIDVIKKDYDDWEDKIKDLRDEIAHLGEADKATVLTNFKNTLV